MKQSKYLKTDSLIYGKTRFKEYVNAIRLIEEPDGFFLLNSDIKDESIKIVYSEVIFNTKFYPIIIKKFSYKLKVEGILHLKIDVSKHDSSHVLGEITRWTHNSFSLTELKEDDNYLDVKLKKTRPNEPADDINKWTFGIVTLGNKNDVVEKIIKSIRAQKIPFYEIIICGTYFDRKEKDCKYIPFNKFDDKGWTTKKKNLICENAKYSNIVVVHDRISFSKNWFLGMKKFGNNFEVLSCKMTHNNKRAFDWISTRYKYTDPKSRYYFGGYLDYSDWDEWIYLDGGASILKKWVWQKVPWPEDRFYAQAEDLKFSHQQSCSGFATTFNPYSTCESISFNHPVSSLRIAKNNKKLGTHTGPAHLVLAKKLMNLSYKVIDKTFNKIKVYDPENNYFYRGNKRK